MIVVRVLATILALVLCRAAAGAATCEWTLFPAPNPYPSGNQLVAVAGSGPTDVWEAGASFGPSESHGYALHYDGVRWTTYLQDSGTFGGQISGLASTSPHEAWAVGVRYHASGYAAPEAAIAHWNGRAFTPLPVPGVAGELSVLYGVTAVTSRDVWAVGGSQTSTGPEESYFVRWDGSAWRRVRGANVAGASTNLVAIAGSSPEDLWSVGDAYGPQSYVTLAEHWNGRSWSVVPTPGLGGRSARFNAVVVESPDDVWAVGESVNGATLAPLTEHWDGTAWRVVPSPDPGGGSVFLLGASADSDRTVWAVGELATGPATVASYTLRWDGSQWRAVYGANVSGLPVTLLNAVAKIPGAGLWSVGGDASLREVFDTVTERRTCRR